MRPDKAVIHATLILLCGCDSDLRSVSGYEVHELFQDKTVSGHHEKHDYDFVSYYGTSTFRSFQDGAGEPRHGEWHIDGDHICIRWQQDDQDLCRTIVTDDRGNYWKVLVGSDGDRSLIVTYDGFINGNPRDL